jgi:hypothetical protein
MMGPLTSVSSWQQLRESDLDLVDILFTSVFNFGDYSSLYFLRQQ